MSSYANPFVIIPLESTSVSQEMHLPACLDSTILAHSIDYSLPLHKFIDPSPPRLAFHIWSAFSSSFSSCSPRRSASRSKRQFPIAMIPHHHVAIFVPNFVPLLVPSDPTSEKISIPCQLLCRELGKQYR